MTNFKLKAAEAALGLICDGQLVGVGDGSTMLIMVELIARDTRLSNSLTLTSPSDKILQIITSLGLNFSPLEELEMMDIYFDGCDVFDPSLNALKSGSGIHTREKIAAAMATEFILVGDAEKYNPALSILTPLVVEVFPMAISSVLRLLNTAFPDSRLKVRSNEGQRVVTGQGNYLVEMYFNEFPKLDSLDGQIKMMAGVANHSLFYNMASKAIIAGPDGVQELYPG